MANVTVAESSNPLGKVGAWYQQVKDYVGSLRDEMRRVSWPSAKQVRATTGVVLVAIFLFAFYFAVVDMLFGKAITQIFTALTRR